MKHGIENIKKSIERNLYARMVGELKGVFAEKGFKGVGEKVLHSVGIVPISANKEVRPESLKLQRLKLNTEQGLVIANHPGSYETFVVLSTLERADVKIVVNDENYGSLSKTIGTEHLISTPQTLTEARQFLEQIKSHIKQGGIVFIYPSGGDGRNDEAFSFQSGFEKILTHCLSKDDMVYTFFIDTTTGSSQVTSKKRMYKAGSAILTNDFFTPNQGVSSVEMPVNEQYTTALQWLTAMQGVPKQDRSDALTKYYTEVTSSEALK